MSRGVLTPPVAKKAARDDGRWLVGFFAATGSPDIDGRLLEQEARRQMEEGRSIEEALLAALPAAGMWAYAEYYKWDELVARVRAGAQAVVQVAVRGGRGYERQFALIERISPETETVDLIFSEGRRASISRQDFLDAWYRYRNWALILSPPARAGWPLRGGEIASLIRFLDDRGRGEEADELARRAAILHSDHADLLAALGARALKRGDGPEAERLLRAALAVDPRHVRAANNLAYLYARQRRRLEEALALSSQALQQEPSNPRVLHTHGNVLGQMGRWAESRAVLESAWQRAQGLPSAARAEIGYSLARAYWETGEHASACRLARMLMREAPEVSPPAELVALLDREAGCR